MGILFAVCAMAACEKPEVYDETAQSEIDEARIKEWMDTTGNVTLQRDPSGLYYQILSKGPDTGSVELKDSLYVEYEGSILGDTTFFSSATDVSPYKFILKNSIPGWKIGLPLAKSGDRIRLVIPSPLAYQDNIVDAIPANSILDFTIGLRKVVKNK